MITVEKIEEAKNRLVHVYNPLKIYIFGSYAWGMPTHSSDLDLLIIVESADKNDFWRSAAGDEALWGLGLDRDMLILTEQEFEEKSQHVSSLYYKIKKEGRVLYARA